MRLLSSLTSPLSIPNAKGAVLQHPSLADLDQVIPQLEVEDLDLRRLVSTKDDSCQSKGKVWLRRKWQEALKQFRVQFPKLASELHRIRGQMKGMLAYSDFPPKGIIIPDPFNITPIEQTIGIQPLKRQQLLNCLIIKIENEVIAFGRLLEVEECVEIVSLWTKKEWRRKGLSSRIISELLSRSNARPIFSFQNLRLIPYYLRQYNKLYPSFIRPFVDIPEHLQRDLVRMNAFWGPNTIIKIGSNKVY